MSRNGERIIFYFGIAVILSGIATILSSPVFFEKRIFDEQNIDIKVTVTTEPTTEYSFLKETTDEKISTTLTAATTTETTEKTEDQIILTTESHFIEYTTGDKIGVTVTVEPTTEYSFHEPTTDKKKNTTLAAAITTETTVSTLAIKEESLPFCQEDPKSTVD